MFSWLCPSMHTLLNIAPFLYWYSLFHTSGNDIIAKFWVRKSIFRSSSINLFTPTNHPYLVNIHNCEFGLFPSPRLVILLFTHSWGTRDECITFPSVFVNKNVTNSTEIRSLLSNFSFIAVIYCTTRSSKLAAPVIYKWSSI